MKPIPLPLAELKPALTGLGKILERHPSKPAHACVRIERTKEGWITLTAANASTAVSMRLEKPDEGEPYAVLIPHDQLSTVAKSCGKEEVIQIATENGSTSIRFALADSFGETKVPKVPLDSFPVLPRLKSPPVPLSHEIRKSVLEAMECVSSDPSRYILSGVLIDAASPKAHYIVATDGKHLYSANSFALPLKESIVIPSHKFLEWKEFNNDGEWQLRAEGDSIQISSRRWKFVTRQIEGRYPDWRVPIPNPANAKTHLTIAPDKLDAVIRLVQRLPCHEEQYHTIGLEWKDSRFSLLVKESATEPWMNVPVPDVAGKGPDLTVFLDRRFLLKALRFGLTNLSLTDSVTALRFWDKGRVMIVMPVRAHGHGSAPAPPQQQPPPPQPPKPMISNPTPPKAAPSDQPPRTILEETLEQAHRLRELFTDGASLARDLSLNLRTIQRQHKTSAREIQSVRSTLHSLKSLKF